jgi:hypothetical protein
VPVEPLVNETALAAEPEVLAVPTSPGPVTTTEPIVVDESDLAALRASLREKS